MAYGAFVVRVGLGLGIVRQLVGVTLRCRIFGSPEVLE
jgi:hypothetical protein